MAATPEFITVFPGTITGQPALLVNARELHAFLEVGRDFSTWLTKRIEEYGFVDQDFKLAPQPAPQNGGASAHGGHNRKDYHITLDMAKELAMVERTEKGRTIRRYFIECERRLMQRVPEIEIPQPKSPTLAEGILTPVQYIDLKHLVWKIGRCFHTANAGHYAMYNWPTQIYLSSVIQANGSS